MKDIFTLPGADIFLLQHKHRKEEEYANDGHRQPADGACGQGEPEGLLVRAYHEGDEAQDSGHHREEYGDDLGIPRLDVGPQGGEAGEAAAGRPPLPLSDFITPGRPGGRMEESS